MRVFILCFAASVGAALSLSAEVTLVNSSFEDIRDGKAEGWALTSGFRAEGGVGHNGSNGLVWESDTPVSERLVCATQEVTGWERGKAYRFSALMRTENFTSGSRGAGVCLEWYDAKGKWLGGGYAQPVRERNADWFVIENSTREFPERAATLKILAYVTQGSVGKVCWDNFTVACADGKPVAFVCSTAYRNVATSGAVTFYASLNIPSSAKGRAKAVFSWTSSAGERISRPADGQEDDSASLSLKVEALALGVQDVVCELQTDGRALGRASVAFSRVAELPKRRVWIDAHQRCIVDGKPFFPLGMYWSRVHTNHVERLDTYAKGPFNCLMPYNLPTERELDLCHERGLMAFVDLRTVLLGTMEARKKGIDTQEKVDAYYVANINHLKGHPAVLAWYVNDEAPSTQVPARTHIYEIFKEHDPDHPTWAVLDRLYDLRQFMPTFDVLGMDPYPVPMKPLRTITDFQRGTQRAVFSSRPLWNVPQAFNWGWCKKDYRETGRFPSPTELRSMNWQHIAGGANGLIAYAFHHYWRDAPADFDRCWRQVCEAYEEVRRLTPILLSDEETPVVTPSTDDVVCRAWHKDGFLYVLACNILNRPIEARAGLSCGEWTMIGTELSCDGTMTDARTVAWRLPPLGVSIVRLERMK